MANPETDIIAEAARQNMPVTWDVLVTDPRIGETVVEGRVAFVRSRWLGLPSPPDSSLDPVVVEYLGLQVAIKVCSVGIDIYSNLANTHTISGEGAPNETENYGDRVKHLQDLKQVLIANATDLELDVETLFKFRTIRTSAKLPAGLSSMNDAFLTSDPREIGPAYAGGTYGRGPKYTPGPAS